MQSYRPREFRQALANADACFHDSTTSGGGFVVRCYRSREFRRALANADASRSCDQAERKAQASFSFAEMHSSLLVDHVDLEAPPPPPKDIS